MTFYMNDKMAKNHQKNKDKSGIIIKRITFLDSIDDEHLFLNYSQTAVSFTQKKDLINQSFLNNLYS